MFTGIIEAVGTVRQLQRRSGDLRLGVETGRLGMQDVHLGDSIATQGICLTVVEYSATAFAADVSLETVAHSTIASWVLGKRVNLEKAMQPLSRFGGHLVSGHVDGVGEIMAMSHSARALNVSVRAPQELMRYIALKGSICVDGISLTVNGLQADAFDLTLVPHTMQQTAFGDWQTGVQVNLEVDIIARYLERLSATDRQTGVQTGMQKTSGLSSGMDRDFLAQHGFL